uniref:Uncharacterized protein n=1 Tax=Sinocyclocheilus rhinocerous TaxID=307959 RepID=A0A673G2S7_9TELE
IDEQRCSLGPTTRQQAHAYSPDPDDFFQFLVNSQSQRLDNQRVTLNSLPGMEAFTIKDPKDGNNNKTLAPKITLTPASPAAPKKVCSRPSSPTLSISEPDTPTHLMMQIMV